MKRMASVLAMFLLAGCGSAVTPSMQPATTAAGTVAAPSPTTAAIATASPTASPAEPPAAIRALDAMLTGPSGIVVDRAGNVYV
jgi:hypothetical protein